MPARERNDVGPFALMKTVLEGAKESVAAYLENEYATEFQFEDAITSWAWLIGDHGFKLPANLIYEAAGIGTREAIETLRKEFDKIDAKKMKMIADEVMHSRGRWFVSGIPGITKGRRAATDISMLEAFRELIAIHGGEAKGTAIAAYVGMPVGYANLALRELPELFEETARGNWKLYVEPPVDEGLQEFLAST